MVVFAYQLGVDLLMQYTYSDLAVCFGCGIFIWLYIIFHVQSIFIATMSMLSIFASIPLSLILYNYVFRVNYFSLLHNLVIIIVLAIGADDIFVFNDMWK
jgi:hypothetical protein